MKNREWRQMVLSILFTGSLWQRYLTICAFVLLAGAAWLYGPNLVGWWFNRPDSIALKVTTSFLLLSGFAVFVALFNLLWVNRATQGRAFSDVTIALLLKSWKKGKGRSRSREGTE